MKLWIFIKMKVKLCISLDIYPMDNKGLNDVFLLNLHIVGDGLHGKDLGN